MKRKKVVVGCAVTLFIALLLCSFAAWRYRHLPGRYSCLSNMISYSANLSSSRDEFYPTSLVELAGWYGPGLLTCPASGEERATAAPLATARADYIYVAGLSTEHPMDMPIVLCPPINHGDKGGNVLCTDYSVLWLRKQEMDRLIDKLYADTNLTIVVSEALTKRSRGRYKSRP